VLPEYGVSLIEIERKQAGGAPISASRVRELLCAGDPELVASLVPPSTLAYLRSSEAGPVLDRLRTPSATTP
jgi:[citrate (pro-3S)-lyase] ligase